MPKNSTTQRNSDIRNDYIKWTNKKGVNARKFTDNYIFEQLANQYYLSAKTIENIVFHRV